MGPPPRVLMESALYPDPEEFVPRHCVERVHCKCGWHEVLVPLPVWPTFKDGMSRHAMRCPEGHVLTESEIMLL